MSTFLSCISILVNEVVLVPPRNYRGRLHAHQYFVVRVLNCNYFTFVSWWRKSGVDVATSAQVYAQFRTLFICLAELLS
jgi:hypothetical protein